jgi:hypothetical protein
MRGAKPCPNCGFLLRYEDPPEQPAEALRFVAVQVLLWIAVALLLAGLWAPAEMSEPYALLGFAALGAWLWLRPRQRARGRAFLGRRRYLCAQCGRRYTGADFEEGSP